MVTADENDTDETDTDETDRDESNAEERERGWRDVRPVVLGIVWRDGTRSGTGDGSAAGSGDGARELLVSRLGPFEADGEVFYRPPGGGVEFGEPTAEAVVREFDEELGATVTVEGFAGVVENRFEFRGDRSHELCFAYEVSFADGARYERTSMHGVEHDSDVTYDTEWATLDDLESREEALYPKGLRRVLEPDRIRVAPGDD